MPITSFPSLTTDGSELEVSGTVESGLVPTALATLVSGRSSVNKKIYHRI
jgi:hypothetical protein